MVLKRDLHSDKAVSWLQGGISGSCLGERKGEQQPTAPPSSAPLPAFTLEVLKQRVLLYSSKKYQ